MDLIVWRKEFETGVAEVDHEHRELVDLINQLHAQLGEETSKETVSRFLGEVFARISAHFALEETVMRKHRYDEYQAHKTEHEALLDQIRDIMDDYEAGAYAERRPGPCDHGARLVRQPLQDQGCPLAQNARRLSAGPPPAARLDLDQGGDPAAVPHVPA
jgi:hemerythrin